MKRVAILGSFAPSLTNFRGRLISDMVAAGHTVFAMAPDIDDKTDAELRKLGAEPVSITLSRGGLNPFEDLSSLVRLRRFFANNEIDVLISYTIKPVIWGSIAARLAGVGTIVPMITGLGYAFIDSSSFKQKLTAKIARMLYRLGMACSHHVIFQNDDDLALFRKLGIVKPNKPTTVVSGSGVDCDWFPSTPLPPKPAFLMIARLLGNKGVRELGEAVKAVKAECPDVPIRLAGYFDKSPDAVGEDEIARFVENGLEYIGPLDDVRPALKDASIFVLPSYREGTPRTVLEAMAMGRAIIVTDVPGCRQTVTEGVNGLLVLPRNPVSLADAMIELARDPKRVASMGAQSRSIAVTQYEVGKVNIDILSTAGLIEAGS